MDILSRAVSSYQVLVSCYVRCGGCGQTAIWDAQIKLFQNEDLFKGQTLAADWSGKAESISASHGVRSICPQASPTLFHFILYREHFEGECFIWPRDHDLYG